MTRTMRFSLLDVIIYGCCRKGKSVEQGNPGGSKRIVFTYELLFPSIHVFCVSSTPATALDPSLVRIHGCIILFMFFVCFPQFSLSTFEAVFTCSFKYSDFSMLAFCSMELYIIMKVSRFLLDVFSIHVHSPGCSASFVLGFCLLNIKFMLDVSSILNIYVLCAVIIIFIISSFFLSSTPVGFFQGFMIVYDHQITLFHLRTIIVNPIGVFAIAGRWIQYTPFWVFYVLSVLFHY